MTVTCEVEVHGDVQSVKEADTKTLLSRIKTFATFLSAVGPAFVMMDWGGTAIGGIWLLAVGEWRMLLLGVGAIFLARGAVGWMIALLALPAMWLTTKARKRGSIGLLLCAHVMSNWVLYVVISIWMIFPFHFFVAICKPSSLIPACLFAYAVATFPLSSLVPNGLNNVHTMLSLGVIKFAALVLIACYTIFHLDGSAFLICNGILNTYFLIQFQLLLLQGSADGSFCSSTTLRRLCWYEKIWAFFPGLLVPVGGPLWGLLGAMSSYANFRIFADREIPVLLKYLLSLAVSCLAVFTFFEGVILLRLCLR